MKIVRLILVLTAVIFSTVSWAHPEHEATSHRAISQSQAMEVAFEKLTQLIEEKKVNSSWSQIKASGAEFKRRNNQLNWVVSFKNEKAQNKEQHNLLLFLSNTGAYISMDYIKS